MTNIFDTHPLRHPEERRQPRLKGRTLLQPQPPRSPGNRKGQALGDELIGTPGLFACLVGRQHLGLDGIERGEGPRPRLAQKFTFSLPKHPDRFGRLGKPNPLIMQS